MSVLQKKGNFLLMNLSEFRPYLKALRVTRSIDRVQHHHTASPNYSTRAMKNGVGTQDKFKCLEGMRSYHKSLGWSATGQNITIFEDGMVAISLDRGINSTPAGIAYSNTGALCIESIGYFDAGQDRITDAQKKAIVHVTACLLEKVNLTPSTKSIVYHHWYAADGTKVFDFNTGARVSPKPPKKTCPGTFYMNVMGGNTVQAAKAVLIPLVQAELSALKGATPVPPTPIKEEDIPMTKEERELVEKLTKRVEVLEKDKSETDALIEQLTGSKDSLKSYLRSANEKIADLEAANSQPCPAWAKASVLKASKKLIKGKPLVDTPDGGSIDFYRMIVVLDRAGLLD